MQFQQVDLELVEPEGNCSICGRRLVGTSLLIDQVNEAGRWNKVPVHPICYKPTQPMPIHCAKKVPQEIESVVNAWNKQFELEDYSEKFKIVEMPSIELRAAWATAKKRCWLEVFKFFAPEELALGLACTSRELYLYSWDTELWGASPNDLGNPDVGRRRACYILSQLNRCVSCGDDRLCRLIRCPILRKPLCVICRENPGCSPKGNKKYTLRLVSKLLKKYGINHCVLDSMRVPITYDRRKKARAYDFMVAEAVKRYSLGGYGHAMETRRKKAKSAALT